MAPDGGGASKSNSTGKSGGGTSRHTLKKGPWTAAEDAILMEYVKKHGEGNWNAVQRNSGLMRCGKSCRLRWANHLRPNLKKGAFTAEEEALIVELHAKLGNKWARMAAQLPGRTDNEIKNYWNTRLKRRQRAGLPIYPHDVQPPGHHRQENSQSNLSPSPLVDLLSSPSQAQKPVYNAPRSIYDLFNSSSSLATPQHQPNSSYLSDPNQHFEFFPDSSAVALSLSSSNSPFSSSSASLPFNSHGLSASLSIPSLQYNCLNFGSDSTPISGVSFEQCGVVSGAGLELPSIQSFVPSTTPTSSANTANDYVIATSSDVEDQETNGGFSRGNSGLLEDLLGESNALTRVEKPKEILSYEEKSRENYLWDYKLMEDAAASMRDESALGFGQDNVILQKQSQDSSPAHSSIGTKTKNASSEDTNPVDDDLLSLLDNFPLTVPVPDWYDGNGNISNGRSSNSVNGEAGKDNQPESSNSPGATTSGTKDHELMIGTCCWKNLPGIYQI